MNNALVFIINTLFQVACFLFLARFILQACRADFYNPISQGIVKATDPVLRPMRIVIKGYRNFDIAAFIAAWLLQCLALALIVSISTGYAPGLPFIAIRALYDVLQLLITIYWFAIIIVIVLSFIAPGSYHPLAALLVQVTEPVLAPARRLIPPLGGLDLSPILVFMVLTLLREYLLPAVFTSLLS
jgi:YggT family protein